jgi:hypothetical protein
LDSLLSCDLYHFHDTRNTMVCFGFTGGLIPDLCSLLSCFDIFFSYRELIAYVMVAEAQNFSPNFLEAHNHQSQYC